MLQREKLWVSHEQQALRNVTVRILESTGRFQQLVDYAQQWMASDPESTEACRQYLMALVKTDQLQQANQAVAQWVRAALDAEETPQQLKAQLESLRVLYEYNADQMWDPQWRDLLVQLGVKVVRDPNPDVSILNAMLGDYQVRQSESVQKICQEIVAVLSAQLSEMPLERASQLVSWLQYANASVDADTWRAFATTAQQRWAGESQIERKHRWGQSTSQLWQRVGVAQRLVFLRRQVQEGPEKYRSQYCQQLLQAVLEHPWQQQLEDEALTLLPQLSDASDAQQKLRAQVAALLQLTDKMVQARYNHLMQQGGNHAELTRTELRDLQMKQVKQARADYAAHLRQWRSEAPQDLVAWATIEWIYLAMQLETELDVVEQECWEFLGHQPVRVQLDEGGTNTLPMLLGMRHLQTMLNLAARRGAEPEMIQRLLKYLEQGESTSNRPQLWRQLRFQLLVALDQTEQLTQLLPTWLVEDDPFSEQWTLALAYFLAEQGKVDQAIERVEPLHAADLLSASDLETLATWYLVADRRADYEQAQRQRFEMVDEWQLSRWLESQLRSISQQVNRGAAANSVPDQMHPDVPRVLDVLLAKSSNPQQQLNLLRRILPQYARLPAVGQPGRRHGGSHGRARLSVAATSGSSVGRRARGGHLR